MISELRFTPDKVAYGKKTKPTFKYDGTSSATPVWYVKIYQDEDHQGTWTQIALDAEGNYTVPNYDCVIFFKVVVGTEDSYNLGYTESGIIVCEPGVQHDVPVMDILFNKDIDGHDIGDAQYNSKNAVVTIAHPVLDWLIPVAGTSRSATKISRKLNKNIIYINFPTYKESSGGYGYDLGFVEDTFTFTIVTTDFDEYERVFSLCKINVGEVSGTLHIGKIDDTQYSEAYPYSQATYNDMKNYKVLVRSSDAEFEPGTFKITYTLTVTVVYDGS